MTSSGFQNIMERLRRYKKILIPAGALILAAAVFGAGYFLGHRSAPASAESSTLCTISYMVGGKLYDTEELEAGTLIQGIGCPETDSLRVLGWTDGNGWAAEPAGLTAYTDMSFTAVTAPVLRGETGYLPCENGLFRPESPLTRLEAAELLYALMVQKPGGRTELRDVEKSAGQAYTAAYKLVSAGLMEAPDGIFDPDGSFTEESFAALLGQFYPADELNAAMDCIRGVGSQSVTRAEAALCINTLLGLSGGESAYFPDVAEDYWAAEAVFLAGQEGNWGRSGRADAGFMNIDGYLYHVEEDGYFLKNAYVGSLFFDNNGRYTSGSEVLDEAVAAAIRETVTGDMEREEMLRAMYLYVRDGFQYLRRNYYKLGDTGWSLEEAIFIYTNGRGNCYSYASAFWAAARGLGYDAMTVSGTIGSEQSPHGWVEIPMEDGRYVFDVEIEMAYRRDGRGNIDMYKLPHLSARYAWLYVELTAANSAAPRDTGGAFALR